MNQKSCNHFTMPDENCRPNYPADLPDLNEPPFRGSFNQLFNANIGRIATVEYISGNGEIRAQTGIIENVSTKWVSLRNLHNNTRMVGDLFAVRFITFLCE